MPTTTDPNYFDNLVKMPVEDPSAPATASAEPSKPQAATSYFDDMVKQSDAEQESLKSHQADYAKFLLENTDTVPHERAKEIFRLSRVSSYPMGYVRDNFDEVSKDTRYNAYNWAEIQRKSPALVQYMQNPDNVALIRDDVQKMSNWEAWVGKWRINPEGVKTTLGVLGVPGFEKYASDYILQTPERGMHEADAALRSEIESHRPKGYVRPDIKTVSAEPVFRPLTLNPLFEESPGIIEKEWDRGVANAKFSYRAYGYMFHAKPVPWDKETVDYMMAQTDLGESDRGIGLRIFAGAAGTLPMQIHSMVAAGTAAKTAAALTAVGGPAVQGPAAAVAGLAGAFQTMNMLEGGAAYWQYQLEAANRGIEFDPQKASYYAAQTGIANGLTELVPETLFLKPFLKIPEFKRMFTGALKTAKGLGGEVSHAAFSDAFPKVSMKRAFMKTMLDFELAHQFESGVEAEQQIITDVNQERSISAMGGKTNYSYIPKDAYEAYKGAWLAFIPMMALGSGGVMQHEYNRKRTAQENSTNLFTTAVHIQALKTAQTSPEEIVKLSQSMQKPETVFFKLSTWNETFSNMEVNGKKLSPREASRTITGSDNAYDDAISKQGDVEIPYAAWSAHIAPNSELISKLTPDSRMSAAEPYLSEYIGGSPEIEAMAEEPVENYDSGRAELYSTLLALIPDHANITEEQKDHAARVWTSTVTQFSRNAGFTNPMDYWRDRQYQLSIQNRQSVATEGVRLSQSQNKPATLDLPDGRSISVQMAPMDIQGGRVLVNVDVAAFDAAFAKDQGFYIPPNGVENRIGNRYETFQDYLTKNDSMRPSYAFVGEDGRVGFTDGRHRWSVLRDMGVKNIPVMMNLDSALQAVKFGLATQAPVLPDPSSVLYQRKYKSEADEANKNLHWEPARTAEGKIQGAAEWINDKKSPSARTAAWNSLEDLYRQLLREGIEGRWWYENSSVQVLNLMHGDVVEAERFIQLLALYSPQRPVFTNTQMALRAYTHWKSGKPRETLKVNTGEQDAKAREILYDSKQWVERKTGSFYANLMHEVWARTSAADHARLKIRPEVMESILKPVTIDVWMLRAAGYLNAVASGGKKRDRYSLMENLTQKIAAELNQDLPEGETPWIPHQVQAAIWTAIKARYEIQAVKDAANVESMKLGFSVDQTGKKPSVVNRQQHEQVWRKHALAATEEAVTKQIQDAKLDFGDMLSSLSHRITTEVVPSPDLASPIEKSSFDARRAFTSEMADLLNKPGGMDELGRILGVEIHNVEVGTGGFRAATNPNIVITITPVKEAGEFSQVEANAVARAVQRAFQQQATPYFRPEASPGKVERGKAAIAGKEKKAAAGKLTKEQLSDLESKRFALGFKIKFRSPLSQEQEAALFADLMRATTGDMGYTLLSDRESLIITNYSDMSDADFTEAIKGLAEARDEQVEYVGNFGAQGRYGPEHDWKADSNGSVLLDSTPPAVRSALQDWTDRWQHTHAAVLAKHQERLASTAGLAGVRGSGERGGRVDAQEPQGFSVQPRREHSTEAVVVRYSRRAGLTHTDPSLAGLGYRGKEETRRFGMGQYGKYGGYSARAYYYLQEGDKLPVPESMVDGPFVYRTKLTNLYDLRVDPLGLGKAATNRDKLEESIHDAGFDGLISDPSPTMHGPFVVVFNLGDGVKIPVTPVEQTSTLYQAGWHGSPYDFDKFDIGKIGQGEGGGRSGYVGAYGWGLYFANDREVAEWYRENLTEQSNRYKGKTISQWLTDSEARSFVVTEAKAAKNIVAIKKNRVHWGTSTKGISWDRAKELAIREYTNSLKMHERNQEQRISNLELATPDSLPEEKRKIQIEDKYIKFNREMVAAIEKIDTEDFEEVGGQLYEVSLPDDDHLANYEKVITDQPKAVKDALVKAGLLREGVKKGQWLFGVDTDLDAKWFTWKAAYEYMTSQVSLGEPDFREKVLSAIEGRNEFLDAIRYYNREARAVSTYLDAIGIPGHSFTGATSRKRNFVIYNDHHVEIQNKYYQDQENGFISFAPGGRTFDITLLDGADVSTLMHEMSHFFVNVLGDEATRMEAPEQQSKDYKTLLDWMGYASHDERMAQQKESAALNARSAMLAERGETLPPEQQARLDELIAKEEKLARGFERYIMDGRTPTEDLAATFTLMRAWLKKIYLRVSRLGVNLTPEVRGVFDRMFAADAAVEKAEERNPFEPDEQAREAMTTQERKQYDEANSKAHTEAQDELRARLIRDQKEALTSWFKKEREEIKGEVSTQIQNEPIYRALRFLQTGEMPDGVTLPSSFIGEDGKPMKIERDSLARSLDGAYMKTAKRLRIYQAKGGLDAEVAAVALGFSTAKEMVQAFGTALPYTQAVEVQTEKVIADRYPDLLKDQAALAEAATLATLSDSRAESLMINIRVLARLAKKEGAVDKMPVNPKSMAEAARLQMEVRKAGQFTPYTYLIRMASAGREAVNLKTAALRWDARVKQLWNLHLYRAATKAAAEYEKNRRRLQKATETTFQQKLGKAGKGFLEAANEVLARISFRKESGVATQKRVDLRAWVADMEANNLDWVIPDSILDQAQNKSYREMTLSEIRDAADAVDNIGHLAREYNSIIGADKKRVFKDEVIPAMIASLQAHMPVVEEQEHDPNVVRLFDTNRRTVSSFYASLLKIEEMVRRMDGGQVNGPWAQFLWNPIVSAQTEERDLTIDVIAEIMKQMETLPAMQRNRLNGTDKFVSKITGKEYTYLFALSVALNTGNEDNLMRLINPTRTDPKWGIEAVEEILQQLTVEDMRFVQGVWDTLEGKLWNRIAALEERQTGLPPRKVDRKAFHFKGEDFAGGYYPLKYDRRESRMGRLDPGTATAVLFDHNYARAMTNHGHTMKRVESFGDPVFLSMAVLPAHLQSVIHDLTHREALLSINKILNEGDLHFEMLRRLGTNKTQQFIDWLHGLANDQNNDMMALNGAAKIAAGSRRNLSMFAMGAKATMFFQNFANIFGAYDQVKASYLTIGMKRFYEDREAQVAFVKGKSGEMRHRFNATERDVRDLLMTQLAGTAKGKFNAKVARFASYATAVSDAAVAYPVWLGAYHQSLDEGMSEEDAVAYADRTVRLTLGGSGQKDLANIQRGNEAMKWLTMFYTFFSTQFNQLSRITWDARTSAREKSLANDWPKLAARTIATIAAQGLLAEYLSGRGPDDDEPWWKWAARKAALFPFLTIPIVREGATYAEAKLTGHYARDIKYGQLAPLAQDVTDAIVANVKWITDDNEFDKQLLKRDLKAGGLLLGLPLAQPLITGDYVWDLATGEEDPDSYWDIGRNLMFTRRKR
jgi:hypothetical protein